MSKTMINDECEEFENWLNKIIPLIKRKFKKKARQGYTGWDDVKQKAIIEMKLFEHIERSLGIEIDIKERGLDEWKENGQWIDVIILAIFMFVIEFYEKAERLK